jgi:hypothetical protein
MIFNVVDIDIGVGTGRVGEWRGDSHKFPVVPAYKNIQIGQNYVFALQIKNNNSEP